MKIDSTTVVIESLREFNEKEFAVLIYFPWKVELQLLKIIFHFTFILFKIIKEKFQKLLPIFRTLFTFQCLSNSQTEIPHKTRKMFEQADFMLFNVIEKKKSAFETDDTEI
jgi:hypothetical protein